MPTRLTSAVADMHLAREHASVVRSFVRGEDSERSDIDSSLPKPDGYDEVAGGGTPARRHSRTGAHPAR